MANRNAVPGNTNITEGKYRAIVENSIHAFFLTILDGTILETNHSATVMFGYSADEFKKIRRWDFIDHTDPKLQQALKQREKYGFAVTEAVGIKKTGEKFPIEITSAVFRDTDGTMKSSTMVSDISLRKKTEADIRLSNERYDLIVKATKDLVWDWDLASGEIYRCGKGLTDVYGHCSNDKIKNIESWAEFLHPFDKERITQQIHHYINSTDETGFSFEYRFRKEDGTYAYINDKGYIMRNAAGKVIRMIGAAEDITERKKAALAIEESEQRYRMFVQNSTEGIWRIDLKEAMHIHTPIEQMIEYCYNNALVAECNDTFAKMYGFKDAGEIIGIPLNKILPENNPVNREYLFKFFSNGFKVQDEISYEYDKNGNQMVIINNMIGIVESGYIKRAWGTQRNITEQKKAEKALAESENRLSAIIRTDPECIKLLDKDGIVLEMNPAGLSMIEADREDQVIGQNVLGLILPQYRTLFKKLITNVFKGHSQKLVFEVQGFKGRKLWMETNCVPFKNSANEITALLSVTRDITESKKAEALLLASEERYRYLFNNNPSSIIIWDEETFNILEVNDTAAELYGYSKEEFLQLSVLDLRSEEERPNFLKIVEQQLRKKEFTKKTMLWKHITSKGSMVMVEITSHKITYKGKQAILALGNNITEKIKLENSLNEERQMRQQQVTEAVISGQEKERTELGQELHDNINQILASTKLYIECALKDKGPRPDLLAESKSLIEKAMSEIRSLSKSLLPPSLGEMGLVQALCEMADNIKLVNDLEIKLECTDTIENELDDKLKLALYRIIQEQMNNVIKHAGAKFVLISIKKEHRVLQVSIKDDGCGFDTNQKRNGVGLRNILSRAEVNDGTVIINSKPGSGCELLVNFTLQNLLKKTA